MLEQSSSANVRTARNDDADALADTFALSWRQAYRGVLPHAHLEGMIARRQPAWWRSSLGSRDCVLVLEVADKIAGYATCGQARGRGRHKGEIYELYLAPIYQGLGFGEHLFEGCRFVLDNNRLNGLVVWALLDNTQACDFYWRRGGRPITSTIDVLGGKRLEKIAVAWG